MEVINGFRGLFSQPLGYVIIRVQIEGVRGYDEDQVALVIPDSTAFGSQVPVTLGTLTINCIINVIKESEIDELSASLNGSRISCLLACYQAELSIRSETAANQNCSFTDLNEAVKTIKKKEIEAFCPRSYIPKQRPYFWVVTCMWWCRPWMVVMDPACLMAWVSWTPIPRWLPAASELQLWWRTWLPLWSPLPRP